MEKQVIYADNAPPAVGPYSHAVSADCFVFTSGQLSLDPKGSGPVRGTLEEETRQVLDNVRAVLTAAGCELKDVIKTTVFLTDINDFVEFNRVYAEYFTVNPPARSCVQVAALPLGMHVEVEAVAVRQKQPG